MNSKKKHAWLTSNQMILVYIIAVFSLIVGIRQPAFWDFATVLNTMRAAIFTMCFALCEMIVIISGGIDVSFPAIGCVAMYVPMYIINRVAPIDNAWFAFGLAILIGLAFGLLNGFLVAILNLPPRPMMGFESCGMLISAAHKEGDEDKLHLLIVDPHIPAGAKLC